MAHAAARVAPAAEVVPTTFDAAYSWNYDVERTELRNLYEKAKRDQWNATDQLAWSTSVDPESEIVPDVQVPVYGTHIWDRMTPAEIRKCRREALAWTLSQFMHGEQGALLATAQIVDATPSFDAKLYGSSQVMDEARHVEVFARYIEEKLGHSYGINANLGALLDSIVADNRWDITYLGMQIMVEGLALAAFGFMHAMTGEPLLKDLLRYVMSDEARHVAFGVLSLQEFYAGLGAAEIRERQEFAYDAAVQLQQRFMGPDVFERMGADPKEVVSWIQSKGDPGQQMFQSMLFSKIVPNCRKLGILDAGDGWLRTKFEELDIIKFEHLVDTTEEYGSLDAIEATPA